MTLPQPATQNNGAGTAWQVRRARRRLGDLSLGTVSLRDRAGRSPQRRCRRPQVVTAPARISSSTRQLPIDSDYRRLGLLPWGPADRPPADAGVRDSKPKAADCRAAVSVGASWLNARQWRRGGLRGKRRAARAARVGCDDGRALRL